MWTEITRRKYERAGQRYASDLTEAEWALIEPLCQRPNLWAARNRFASRAGRNPLYRADGLSVANAAERLSAVHDGARLFLRLAGQRLV